MNRLFFKMLFLPTSDEIWSQMSVNKFGDVSIHLSEFANEIICIVIYDYLNQRRINNYRTLKLDGIVIWKQFFFSKCVFIGRFSILRIIGNFSWNNVTCTDSLRVIALLMSEHFLHCCKSAPVWCEHFGGDLESNGNITRRTASMLLMEISITGYYTKYIAVISRQCSL